MLIEFTRSSARCPGSCTHIHLVYPTVIGVSTRTLGARVHGYEGWKRQYRLLLQARARVVERRRIALGRMDVHVRAR